MAVIRRILLWAVALCLLPAPLVDALSYKRINVPAYFVFGDSLVDVGNNNFLNNSFRSNFPPYGETFFHKPTGRFTNGRTMGDFIAQALGLPFAPPYLQPNSSFTKGVNFASAGSGFLDTTNTNFSNPISIQLEQYRNASAILVKQLGAPAAEKMISESFFVISSGSNDLGKGYLQNPARQKDMNATAYITLVIESCKNTMIQLYQSGARKAVVFGLGPLGCSPTVRVSNPTQPGECLEAGNQLALGFNAGLRRLVDALRVALPDFTTVYAETFDIVHAMVADKKSFGLSDVTAACCGAGRLQAELQCGKVVPSSMPGAHQSLCSQPSKFLFWDLIHPTEHVVRILFHTFWSGDSSFTHPINLKTLAAL